MAMIVLDNTISDINGKLGGTIYRYDQCGFHAQSWPRLINHALSPKQIKRRKCFSRLVHQYIRKLTQDQAWSWQQYANLHPHKNKKGEVIILTWWSQFIKTNINRCMQDLPIFMTPP